MNSINKKLLEIQKEWITEVVEPFIAKGYDEQFSRPFHLGVSDKIDPDKKMIMIVGQEADCFWKYEMADKTPEYIQQWCVNYFNKQVLNSSFDENGVLNNSAFWRFLNMLHQKGLDLCWNNVDKLHRYQNKGATDQTESLSEEYEKQLSAQYGVECKSLLQREIDTVMPDAVVFLTGPNYRVSMCAAFGIPDNALDSYCPTKANICSEISRTLNLNVPVLWTYHPGYLSRNAGFMEKAVDSVLKCV